MLLNAFNILHSSLKEKSIELQKLNSELEMKVENRTNKLKNAYKKMKDLASIDDLTKIKGMPNEKIKIIALYLDF